MGCLQIDRRKSAIIPFNEKRNKRAKWNKQNYIINNNSATMKKKKIEKRQQKMSQMYTDCVSSVLLSTSFCGKHLCMDDILFYILF